MPDEREQRRLAVRAAFVAAARDIEREAADGRPPYDADEVGLQLAMAAEEPLGVAARAGAEYVRAEGVPGNAVVTGAGLDAAPDALVGFAGELFAALTRRTPYDDARPVPLVADLLGAPVDAAAELAERAAYVAGAAAATRGHPGWQLRQRFGEPYCQAQQCYGNNGRLLPLGAPLPPYAQDCNCTVEAGYE